MSASSRRVLIVAFAVVLAAALAAAFTRACQPAPASAPSPLDPPPTRLRRLSSLPPVPPLRLPVTGISGTIHDLDGHPLAGAHVCAWRLGPAWLAAERPPPRCVDAGPDGFYTLTGLSPAPHAIHASAAHHRPMRLDSDLSLRPGEIRVGVDLTLPSGGARVTGLVQDLSGGVIDGAWVTSGDGRDAGTAATRSDSAGRFTLWLAPGFAHLFGQADGYADASDHGSAPGAGFLLVLTPESVLVGQVLDAATRAPVLGARVTVVSDLSEGGVVGMGLAFTGADGQFRLTRLQPGRYKPTVHAAGSYGEAARSVHLGLGLTSDPVTILVHPVAGVRGRVTVAGGPDGCPRGEVILSSRTGIQTLIESTDPSGAVEFPAVRPDVYDVQVLCPGYVIPTSFPPVTVGPTPVAGLTWDLGTGRAIRGVVLDSHGRGAPGLSVSAQTADFDPAAQSAGFAFDDGTDLAGRFELAGLIPGTYNIQVYGESLRTPQVRVTAELGPDRDTEQIRIILPESGQLHGLVLDLQGQPAARAQVFVHGPDDLTTGATTAGDGAFLIPGLPPGDYRAYALRSGAPIPGEPPADHVTTRVLADASADIRLTVPGTRAQIRGAVRHADGDPVTDAFVTAVRERPDLDVRIELRWGGHDLPVLTDADGNFTLPDLLDGPHALRAYRRGGGEVTVEHVLTGTTTTLTIAPTAELAGTLSPPLPDEFAVYLIDNATMVQRVEEFYRTDGRWGFDALPAGTYDLFFESATGAAKHTLTLRPDERRLDLRVSLPAPGTIRGRVLDALTGAPLAGVLLQARPLDGRTRLSLPTPELPSDSSGRFELPRVPAGPVNLSARGPGPATVASDQQLLVEPGRTLDITVPLEDRAPRPELAPQP